MRAGGGAYSIGDVTPCGRCRCEVRTVMVNSLDLAQGWRILSPPLGPRAGLLNSGQWIPSLRIGLDALFPALFHTLSPFTSLPSHSLSHCAARGALITSVTFFALLSLNRYSLERLLGGQRTTVLYKLPEGASQQLPPQAEGGAGQPDSTNPLPLLQPLTGTEQQQKPTAAADTGGQGAPPLPPPPSSSTLPSTDSRGVPLRRAGVQLAAWLRWGSLLSFDSALAAHSLQVRKSLGRPCVVLPAALGPHPLGLGLG